LTNRVPILSYTHVHAPRGSHLPQRSSGLLSWLSASDLFEDWTPKPGHGSTLRGRPSAPMQGLARASQGTQQTATAALAACGGVHSTKLGGTREGIVGVNSINFAATLSEVPSFDAGGQYCCGEAMQPSVLSACKCRKRSMVRVTADNNETQIFPTYQPPAKNRRSVPRPNPLRGLQRNTHCHRLW